MDPVKNPRDPYSDFEAMMENVRPRIRAFLLTLTGSEASAEDLTQEVSLLLWKKRDQFDPRGDFRAWAFRIAFLQAQNFRRKVSLQHDREVPGDDLFEHIAEVTQERHGRDDLEESRHAAVVTCLGKLRKNHRDLILRRYQDEHSLEQLSSEAGINRNAMAQKLFRLKRTLLGCVDKQLRFLNRESSKP
ncbi:MAG: sigma-70 family RNA polymerase sigma factor [Verrucomicrobiales bacterium]|nr:sigma-70 family RNA polymerase sigma factor [Verrucomicrobiales bacterium]